MYVQPATPVGGRPIGPTVSGCNSSSATVTIGLTSRELYGDTRPIAKSAKVCARTVVSDSTRRLDLVIHNNLPTGSLI